MPHTGPSYFHLHLVSDATGETLTIMAKAAAVQYGQVRPIEHVHPLVRTQRQLARVLQEIESAPGIVLYTIVNRDLTRVLEQRCRELGVPSLHVLEPIMKVFESYLGAPQTPIVAGQHVLDADYFRRIDALNFAMAHDDGHLPGDLNEADIIILGISRTSKTPTSIYLAQRGYKTANVPLVPGIEPPAALDAAAQRPSSSASLPAPSESPRSAATACACWPTATSTTTSTARRSPTRSPIPAACARGTAGLSSTSPAAPSRKRRPPSSSCCTTARRPSNDEDEANSG